jgi:N-acetylneuraminate synthase
MVSPLFVAEVSSNHGQDLSRCIEFINISADIGCDAVKFQLFKIDQLFSIEARRAHPEIEKRKRWELPIEFLPSLKNHCDKKGLQFSCTPFYLDAVKELEPFVDFYKVASYELLWHPLLQACAQTGKPLVISTGMATVDEIDHAVNAIKAIGCSDLTLLSTISGYPTPISECNLAFIDTLRERYKVKSGWSDHSVNIGVLARAVHAYGASMVEFHLDIDGQGDEFKTGHCWLPEKIECAIKLIKDGFLASGSPEKILGSSEVADREWRADPIDGLRPLKNTRLGL